MNSFDHTRFNQWLLAGRRVPLPRHLTLEITSFCNLRCRMCPKTNHAVNTAESQVMSREVFDRVVPFLRHIESLDLSGIWGEAFLHPDLYVDMLKKIKEQGSDVYTISNGTLITDDLARKLVENDLNKLTISLDAATPETYALIRPPRPLRGCPERPEVHCVLEAAVAARAAAGAARVRGNEIQHRGISARRRTGA